jgi:hypothetical protein
MELILSSGVLTFLLLVGAVMDLLCARTARHSVYHRDGFSADPKPLHPWNLRRSRYRYMTARLDRSLTSA